MNGTNGSRPLVQFEGVHKRFGQFEALKGIDLEVREGDVFAIIGPSGSGKSTALRCINALERVDAGRVIVDGVTVDHANRALVRNLRKRIGIVFQSFNLFPHMTVVNNVILGPMVVLGLDRKRATDQALALLTRVGLADKANAWPEQLSGGQQQRVAIARALAMNPRLLLLDEVTSALDPELVREVLDVIRTLTESGMTMVLVSHEIPFVREVATQVAFMDMGLIVEAGPSAEVFTNPKDGRLQRFLEKIL